ncbi:imidazolonepropionase [Paraferrimonas haliotis]|uniref:Imidazolonepropionase n=1 Tax=Paraferrimonas haliotis TaxID=2013866 RepID=A0AA37TZA1_9GAMM|nr:imidazolonepropionase [Paraferrimonas haliotis]GLS85015.1 imidazolonepropionase [Paraferrimonas haliotis]
MDWDQLWIDVNLATMDPNQPNRYGAIYNGAIAIKDGKIAWLGERKDLPAFDMHKVAIHKGNNQWMTPGLIDCHTHLVFAGNRADEFEQRLLGASYQELAQQGAGILSTVRATRAAEEEELFDVSRKRLNTLMQEGVTHVEIKSGYGLDLASELKTLKVARYLGEVHPVTVSTTFLGAHALPPEYAGKPQKYIDFVCQAMLPEVAKQQLADAVDVFCENVGFDLAQSKQVLEAAKALGLQTKIHAEQLSNMGASAMAANLGALSSDHIEFLDETGVKALADNASVAVLLPGAFYFLRETQLPPIDLLRRHKVPMALASDFNPGTSPLCSLKLMLNLGCTLFRLTPEEALAGITRNAAQALGVGERKGMLRVGMEADLAMWDIDSPADLSYSYGVNPLTQLCIQGQLQIS